MRAVTQYPACNARIGGRKGWMRRTRPDGTTYSIPVHTGKKCGEESLISIDGQHRCAAHIHVKQ